MESVEWLLSKQGIWRSWKPNHQSVDKSSYRNNHRSCGCPMNPMRYSGISQASHIDNLMSTNTTIGIRTMFIFTLLNHYRQCVEQYQSCLWMNTFLEEIETSSLLIIIFTNYIFHPILYFSTMKSFKSIKIDVSYFEMSTCYKFHPNYEFLREKRKKTMQERNNVINCYYL